MYSSCSVESGHRDSIYDGQLFTMSFHRSLSMALCVQLRIAESVSLPVNVSREGSALWSSSLDLILDHKPFMDVVSSSHDVAEVF